MLPDLAKKTSLYILFAVLLVGTLWRGGYFPQQKWPFAIGLLLAGAVELAVFISSGGWRGLRSFGLASLAVFTIYALATRVWSITPADSDRESLLLLGYLATFFVVRGQLSRDGEKVFDTVAQWFVYTASFTAGWGLISFLWRWEPYATMLDNVFRAGSTFEYSNAFSCFSLMALPVCVAMWRKSEPRDRPLLAAAASLLAAAALLSYSRFGVVVLAVLALYLVISGWRGGFALSTLFSLASSVPIAAAVTITSESKRPLLGLAASTGIVVAVYTVEYFLAVPNFRKVAAPKLRKAFGAAAVAAAVGSLAAAVVLARSSERMREIISIRFSEGFSWSRLFPHRLATWQGTVDAFRVRPLTGSGLGSFPTIFTQHAIAVYTKYAHNLILQTAVDTGIIGAVLLVIFLGYIVFLSGWRLIARSKPLVRAFGVTSLVFIAYNLFDWEWYVPALTAWFIVGAACLEGLHQNESDGNEPASAPKTGNRG